MTHDKNFLTEMINRLENRKLEVWKKPNPYIQPLWEISEIKTKIKELKGKLKIKS